MVMGSMIIRLRAMVIGSAAVFTHLCVCVDLYIAVSFITCISASTYPHLLKSNKLFGQTRCLQYFVLNSKFGLLGLLPATFPS